jgi:tetratricopeptide (TPR) repeat protein
MTTSGTQNPIEQAKTAYEAEDYEEAARWYEQAANQCTARGDLVQAAEMSNNRSVSLLRANNPQAALQASQGTELVFAKAGDARRQAMALGNQASALEGLKKDDEALQLYRRSNEILKELNDHELRIYILQSMSGLHLRHRRYLEAMAAMHAALEIKPHLSLRERFLKKLLQIVYGMLGH